jgi:hypothetical protein
MTAISSADASLFGGPRESAEALPATGQHPAPMALSPLPTRAPRPAPQVRSAPEQLPLFPAPIAYRKAG